MKKLVKLLAYGLGLIGLLLIALLTYVKTMLPDVGPPPDLKIQTTTEMVERGKYLAHHVMLCMDCHSTRDWQTFSGPMVAGTEGKGGETFDQKLGFPGKFVAPNITPVALQNWTDGEIFRAITSGVSKNGNALFNIMPHHNYGQLDRRDVEAVIAYIRTLKPIEHKPAISSADFPMNFIINTIPKKPQFSTRPQPTEGIAYGKYLVTAAGCMDCHTKQDKGKFVGEPYAGNFAFPLPDGSVVRSSNITPDKETGLGAWTEEQFVARFKMFADSAYVLQKPEQGEFQTVMPWTMYAGMNREDLQAIYAYLHSLAPVTNAVERFTPVK
ncbi:MAG: c-type cytochrome [Flammeovirgaceae bacterium]|nr:MAG: c-type cytochrome [Flammeovirgaceae bacterium]